MVSDETAKRIADALDRLATAVERKELAVALAAVSDDVKWADAQYMIRILPTTAPLPFTCYRCIPAHAMDWANPCKSHQP